ncbi:agmatine deiminase [Marinomonas posidonica]|uniref:agmatine deiminase n=1 Tax=Marinomonas posidonica TaxID=936476 RepID=UPI003734C9FF
MLTTPLQDGFWMPGEHAPQQAVWLAWPTRVDNWRQQAKPAQRAFLHFIHQLQKVVQVNLAVLPELVESVRECVPKDVEVHAIAYNDAWMRDIGPTIVVNQTGEKRAVNWQFNAWGGERDGLYEDWQADQSVASKVAKREQVQQYDAPFILEGGAIHCDGEGTLYTTEECLLHPSRNPHLSKAQVEANLREYLGVEKVIWLPKGLYNDETNGHIDNILHVVRPGEVMLTVCEDPSDPQYDISMMALDILKDEKDAQGRNIKVYALPMPGPLYISETEATGLVSSDRMAREAGERLAASYANFLICNDSIFYPLLDEQEDKAAARVFAQAFPNHKLIGIPARDILLGGGNLHCISQQIPR